MGPLKRAVNIFQIKLNQKASLKWDALASSKQSPTKKMLLPRNHASFCSSVSKITFQAVSGFMWMQLPMLAFCETWLLLAALIYSWENIGYWKHSTWSLFSSWQNWILGKKLPMHQPLTKCMMSTQDKQDTRKKGCQTLPGQDKRVLKVFLPLKMVCHLL